MAWPRFVQRSMGVWLAQTSIAGDYHSSPGMREFASLVMDIYPGIFVHSVYIYQDQDKDTRAGFVRSIQ
jgi:hypothetical protein